MTKPLEALYAAYTNAPWGKGQCKCDHCKLWQGYRRILLLIWQLMVREKLYVKDGEEWVELSTFLQSIEISGEPITQNIDPF